MINSYTAQFKLTNDVSIVRNDHLREHCRANLNQIKLIGRNVDQQVRIEIPTANGTTRALYTVTDIHDEEPNAVYLGYTNLAKPWERLELELDLTDNPTGKVTAQVTAEGLTDAEAEAHSEFIENVTDNGHNHGLVVIAPHGGNIEKYTDEQAEHLGQKLSSKYVSEWICKGFDKGGGAFNRWHITSTDISEESFPKLKTIFGRYFEYSVAFHGWGGTPEKDKSICIGGTMKTMEPETQRKIKEVIEDAVSGSSPPIEVKDDGCPRGFNGNNSQNIVNRLSTKGLQIEQSEKARKCYGIDIADAVADVIGPIIQV